MITPLKYLDVSTAHVKYETMNPPHPRYLVAEYTYGAFFYVPAAGDLDADLDEDEDGTPPDLLEVLQLARANGCTLVRLDCDGEEYGELETYSW